MIKLVGASRSVRVFKASGRFKYILALPVKKRKHGEDTRGATAERPAPPNTTWILVP